MNRLIEHIEYLVAHRDCVVLPTWGAFVSRNVAAHYVESESRFYPPAREVGFNSAISHDDGIVAASISRKEGISFEAATRIVAEEIQSMRSQLCRDGEISLGRLGRFIYQEGSTPLFEQSKAYSCGINLSNGAAPFIASFLPLDIKTLVQVVEDAHSDEQEETPSRIRRFGLKAIRVAASITLFAALGYGLIVPIATSREDEMAAVTPTTSNFTSSSQTSLVVPSSPSHILQIAKPQREYRVSEDVQAPIVNSEDNQSVDSSLHKESVASSNKESFDSTSSTLSRSESGDKYCLIVASLPTRQGAEKYISETQGYDLQILAQDGKFRVYVASANSSADLVSVKSRSDISSKFPEAWVCRRK